MEMLSSSRGDKHEFCLAVIKFKHVSTTHIYIYIYIHISTANMPSPSECQIFHLFRCVLSSVLSLRSVGRSNFNKGLHNLTTLI